MADVLRGRAHDLAVRDLAQLHSIVGHKAVAALDQLDRQLALADAAVAQDQDPFTIHLHQHAVAGDAGGQLQVQHTDEAAHQGAGRFVGAQQRHAVLFGQLLHLREGSQFFAAADDNSRRLLTEQLVQRFVALFRRKAGQEVHLGQTHDLQPQFIKVIVIARQEQTRTVDFRDLDADVFEVLRSVDHIHADLFGQLLERNGKIRHLSSSCVYSSTAGRPSRRHSFSYYKRDGFGLQ